MEKELPKKSTPQRIVANCKDVSKSSPSQKQLEPPKAPKIIKVNATNV